MQLLCHPLCAPSRFVRLVAGECGLPLEAVEVFPWEREAAFLALNPAGTTPVLLDDGEAVVGASVIAEYWRETRTEGALLPSTAIGRAETRRLLDWFLVKLHEEAIRDLVHEKMVKRFLAPDRGGGSPVAELMRVARVNLRQHLSYLAYLVRHRNWLAGEALTLADLAAAAQLSVADYLGEVPWEQDEGVKLWYARLKSRPAFRPLLAERLPGMAPPAHYADPDF